MSNDETRDAVCWFEWLARRRLARLTGRSKSYYARELIEGNLDDLEDRYLAEARLEKR